MHCREGQRSAHTGSHGSCSPTTISAVATHRANLFRRNAQPSEDISRHPHFLKYLRYFVYGPDLPEPMMTAFEAEVEDCGMITSGDILPLAKLARQQARSHRLPPKDAAEEFYKLALELGLDADQARTIRDKVRTK